MRLRQSTLAPFRCSAQVLGGRYRLDAVIGSGGAGDVHRGFDLRLKRPVAVKLFRAGTGGEDGFHNEAVILARLRHPGLVTVYDAGRHDGRAYLVMELIEGPTLKARIAAGPLAPGETAALGADLARALAHAHDAGIVHRDVKPSNIILDGSGRPHLTDFGISRLLDATTHTATDALIGTAAYLSPEQVLGQSVGPSADVYALGLVLLECVTSRLEYDGAPLESAIARLHRRPELPDSLPKEFAGLLGDMTDLDAQARPSADDCVRSLTALADTLGPRPVPPPADVTSLVSGQVPAAAELTHPYASHAAGTAAPKAASTRGRHLVVGTAAALAAAVAATLAVSDGSAHRAATREVSSPSAKDGTPGASVPRDERGPAPAKPSSRDVPAGDPRDPGLDQAAGLAPAVPYREPAADTHTHGTSTTTRPSRVAGTPDTASQGKRAEKPAGKRSDKSRNAEKPRRKKAGKKGGH
ncbi:serine/threonine-protein kinase [Streptomyces cyanogenus]|uniref:non-specific serine/threonine protein kinase n=1 Tax=Streptomyces cyanogenus TaxID=80860 RepID=A0ABX7U2A6_STRCY|nr:serine/threonine-protein kinase [Streptomyces cyanogenus]QTE02957.1 Serine/threonine-protein kinase PrkC [Streptomyces cyanogenus]